MNKINATMAKIFSPSYYAVYELCIRHTLILVVGILDKMSIWNLLKNEKVTVNQIQEKFALAPQAKLVLMWMLDFAYENDWLVRYAINDDHYYASTRKRSGMDRKHIEHEILKIDPSFASSIKLMNSVAESYPMFLKGNNSGVEILFAPKNVELWMNYFSNDFTGYAVFNQLGAYEVVDMMHDLRNIKILELGGGGGSAAEVLLQKLDEEELMERLDEYIFSDISPVFLRIANKKIMESQSCDAPYSLKKIDFNCSLLKQRIGENSLDIIYGVNSLHVARNLDNTLRYIFNVLKDSGSLIISELVRTDDKKLFQEFIFCLLDSYREVELEPPIRPWPGFMSEESWGEYFKRAGFVDIEVIDNYKISNNDFSGGRKIAAVIKGKKKK